MTDIRSSSILYLMINFEASKFLLLTLFLLRIVDP